MTRREIETVMRAMHEAFREWCREHHPDRPGPPPFEGLLEAGLSRYEKAAVAVLRIAKLKKTHTASDQTAKS